jgi:predicted MPP superfamily phosphohydrolase
MQKTAYILTTEKSGVSFKAAVVADLHDRDYTEVLPLLEREEPDMILVPGDVTEALSSEPGDMPRAGYSLLSECAAIAPTFYSLGNHEIGGCHGNIRRSKKADKPLTFSLSSRWRKTIESTGVVFLDEDWICWRGLVIGGLGSGLLNPGWIPNLHWLQAYAATPGYKLLLCHHPEYFDRYLRSYDIDLIVSGHAHGGQWRILGRGVYAPDQGLFPKYTSGLHENRLVISRGVANTVPFVPRLFNPREVVTVEVRTSTAEKN